MYVMFFFFSHIYLSYNWFIGLAYVLYYKGYYENDSCPRNIVYRKVSSKVVTQDIMYLIPYIKNLGK